MRQSYKHFRYLYIAAFPMWSVSLLKIFYTLLRKLWQRRRKSTPVLERSKQKLIEVKMSWGKWKKIFLGTLYLHPPTFLQPSLPPPLSLPPLHYHHHSVLIYSNSYYFLFFLLFLFSMFPSFLFLFVPFLGQKVLFWGYWLGSKKFLESTHTC